MQSQLESDRLSIRSNLITTDRPDSSQLVDLHVYIIPKNVWKDRQNLAENEAMDQAISAGFVRVPQNLNIHDLRQHILNICGQDNEFPKEFIYLRSVGRCLTKVKFQQEIDLRVKNYRPPMTFAPEIYLLEGHHDDELSSTPNTKSYLFRESPIHRALITPPRLTTSRQQSWVKPSMTSSTTHPVFVHSDERQNSIFSNRPAIASFSNLSTASSTLSARDLGKLREEQERLRLRQIELARQRREIEQEQQNRERDLLIKENELKEQQTHENNVVSKDQQEAAAIRIQATYRGYHYRRTVKQQQLTANEIERLQKEARELARRKAEEEHAEEIEAHDVVKLSDRLNEIKTGRVELEATREAIVRGMQQLHAQITVRRKEERDLWKQKYLIEKKKTIALAERARMASKNETDVNSQIEKAKIRLNNNTKLRQQAENECHLLIQELHQLRLGMTSLEKQSLPQQLPPQQQQQTIPISLDITLQY